MRVLAVTVVYHPDPELLLRSVASYAGAVEKVLVWRNSPLGDALEADLSAVGNVEFRGSGTNDGIPAVLNAASREMTAGGFDALLTMDQDSVWHDIGAFLRLVSGEGAPEGFFAPQVFGPDAAKAADIAAAAPDYSPVLTAFTSGMLIPSDVIGKVGGWCEEFKVDGADNEFCLHARSLGIPLWKVGKGWLEHSLGKVEFRRFLGLRFRVYQYPPERLYGIYRNNLSAIRKYRSVSGPFRRQFLRTWGWRRPLRMLLGEKDLGAKFKAVFKGIRAARKVEI